MTYLRLLPVAVAVCAAAVLAPAPAGAQTNGPANVYGQAPTLDRSTAITVSQALTDTARFNTTLLVSGTIADVCQKKGCWLVVTDGDRQMRVTFKDYGFFVPKDSRGRSVLLQGVVSTKQLPEETARHYAEESKTGPRPEDIHGTQTVTTMEATGVVIADS